MMLDEPTAGLAMLHMGERLAFRNGEKSIGIVEQYGL